MEMNEICCPTRGARPLPSLWSWDQPWTFSGTLSLWRCFAISVHINVSWSFIYCSLCSDCGGFLDPVWLMALKSHFLLNSSWEFTEIHASETLKRLLVTEQRRLQQQKTWADYFKSYSTKKYRSGKHWPDYHGRHIHAAEASTLCKMLTLKECSARFYGYCLVRLWPVCLPVCSGSIWHSDWLYMERKLRSVTCLLH